MQVVVKSSCLVAPRSSRSSGKVLLSAVAHFAWHIQYRTRFMFFQRPSEEEWCGTVDRLKAGLANVLEYFHPVAGRLFVGDDGIMSLDCNGEGVMFTEASASVALEDLTYEDGDFVLPAEELMELSQTNGHALKWPWRSDAPLFFIQVTQFSCGGLCISVKFNHQALDGTSAWHFVKSWAEVCSGRSISVLPTFQDNPIRSSPPCKALPSLPPYLAVLNKQDLLSSTESDPAKFATRCFVFKKEMINKLKLQNPGFSTFQLLTARIWEKITAARNLDEDEATTLHFAVNCRQRVPSLGYAYCGQGALIIGASTTAGQVQELGAALLKKTTAEFTEGEVAKLSELVEAFATDKQRTVHSKTASGKDIVVGSSFHFPVYEDFGFGKPKGMTIVPTPNDGRVYYFPGKEAGSVVAYVSLEADVMIRLEKLI